jgi:hypothetical protein
MFCLATPAVDTDFPPKVKLKARAGVSTLGAGGSQAKLMSKTRLLLTLLQVKKGRVRLHKAVLRHILLGIANFLSETWLESKSYLAAIQHRAPLC